MCGFDSGLYVKTKMSMSIFTLAFFVRTGTANLSEETLSVILSGNSEMNIKSSMVTTKLRAVEDVRVIKR